MLRMSVILMSASGVVLTVLARVLAAALAKIFVGYDEGLFTLTCHAFRLFSFAFLFAGFNIFASSFFTALGNGLISAAISFLRTLVFQTSSVILLPLLLGVDGIWYAITAAEICATILSLIFLLAKRKKIITCELPGLSSLLPLPGRGFGRGGGLQGRRAGRCRG